MERLNDKDRFESGKRSRLSAPQHPWKDRQRNELQICKGERSNSRSHRSYPKVFGSRGEQEGGGHKVLRHDGLLDSRHPTANTS